MRYRLLILLYIISSAVQGQSLQEINYNYLYNPGAPFTFQMKPIREEVKWKVLYQLKLNASTDKIDNYEIQWEQRENLGSKQGRELTSDSSQTVTIQREENRLYGEVLIDRVSSPQVVAARIVDNTNKRAWYFFEFLLPEYPITSFLINSNQYPVFEPHVSSGKSFSFSGEGLKTISKYTSEFPAAAPPFSEGLARVPSVIKADSIFTVSANQSITYDENGLYLVQRDTSSKDGFAFSVYNDYPKYTRLENLADPLIYVCTKQEIEKLKDARGDKKSFDRVILNITGNAERAKKFMRSYFSNVEYANQYFSSYKEGWKTDRGMVYIIFGLPDELYRFSDREVWEYKGDSFKLTFDFVRSPTLFDPDNYVLIRKKKYQDTWYQIIDLWRNARF